MRRAGTTIVSAISMLAIGGCSYQRDAKDAWIRLPAVAGRPGAAYATITGDLSDGAVVRITSPDVARIELHESTSGHHAMGGMRPIARLPVPARTSVRLRPGGVHAMLFGLRDDLRPGQHIVLTFHFDDDTTVHASARLIGAGDPAP